MNADLKMLPSLKDYSIKKDDPIRFYYMPVFGPLYRRRVANCISLLDTKTSAKGRKVLEVGFGSGVSFLSTADFCEEIYGIDLDSDCEKVTKVFSAHNLKLNLSNGNVLKMPYEDNFFDSVLLISILEHLQPNDLEEAFKEIRRVLKPGGAIVYGVPVSSPFMNSVFLLLGYNIHKYHFSTEKQIFEAAKKYFKEDKNIFLKGMLGLSGNIYESRRLIKTT